MRFPGFKDNWEVRTLDQVCERIGDGLHGTPKYSENTGYYFINGNNLVNGEISITETTKEVTQGECLKNDKGLTSNTLLLSINGTIGSVARYKNEKVMLGKSVAYLNLKEDNAYYYQLLQSSKIQNHFTSELTGTTIKNLSLKTIRETEVAYPSPAERDQIGKFLAILDSRIQTQNKIIERLKTLIKSICQKLILSQKPNTPLKNCVTCYSSTLTEADALGKTGSCPIYGATGIISYSEEYQINENAILIIKDGASIGRVQFAKGKFSVIGTLNYLLPKGGKSLQYIFYTLKYFNFSKYKVGSGIPHIYFRDYGEANIYCPNFDEQERIAALLTSIEEKLRIESRILKQLESQKKYLLNYLFI